MKESNNPVEDDWGKIFDLEKPRFFATFPMLAPAVAELDAALASIPHRPAINLFLISFCRLFENEVGSDDDRPIAIGLIGKILFRMRSAGHCIKIGERTRLLRNLYRDAVKECGELAPVFKQLVATMYARRYQLN